VSVKVTQAACIRAELEEMHQRVSQRAFEISQMNHSSNNPEENWFNAQRELIWEPPVEIRESEGRFEVIAAVPGVPPEKLDIRVTPEALLIKGTPNDESNGSGIIRHSEFSRGELFRPIHFREPIDFANATGECRDGLLRLTLPVMHQVAVEIVDEQSEVVPEEKPAPKKAKARKPAPARQKRS